MQQALSKHRHALRYAALSLPLLFLLFFFLPLERHPFPQLAHV
jgi:hypothetical protein